MFKNATYFGYRKSLIVILVVFGITTVLFSSFPVYAQETTQQTNVDPLPSWNDGSTKKAILKFVQDTTDAKNSRYVPFEKRIATFDQDGTLWVEHPVYTQIVFAFDRISFLAPQHPEWKNEEPFKSVLAKDQSAMAKFTLEDFQKIIDVTHTGMTVDAFQQMVKNWLVTAKHPRWQRPYTDLVYQPMLELLRYLRTNEYQIYIVTGGGQDFVRVYAEQVYDIPPSRIIGSATKTQYKLDKQGRGVLLKSADVLLNNNFSGKPEGINLFIGARPVAAFGNSTGDQQMLEYTQGAQKHLMVLIHHDDPVREYAYDTKSKIGTFSKALMDEAKQRGWLVISMKNDWKRIFSFEK